VSTRRRVAAGLAALSLLGLGWLWFRDSGLVAVTDLTVSGVHGSEAPAVRAALDEAARDMTTLHVREDQLRTAVRPYPIVKDLRVMTEFPHGMTIEVIEHDPVAAVLLNGRRVPVASDGTLLRGQPAGDRLLTLQLPSGNGGGRLTDRRALAAVRVMGAAPRSLRAYVTGIDFGPDGLRVGLRGGPLLQFGGAGRARAKWTAAARVLADPRAAGASYLDLRAPERPVAGRFQDPGAGEAPDGTVPGESDGSGEAQASVETEQTLDQQ
jgi:cell division protein FtsQ